MAESLYQQKIEERTQQAKAADSRYGQMGLFRLALVLAAVSVFWFSLGGPWQAWLYGALALAFLALELLMRREEARQQRFLLARQFYELGLARLRGQWAGQGPTGAAWLPANHPYAADLDLFGPGSLFALLCGAGTRQGEKTLAGWLLHASSPHQLLPRQAAVQELAPQVELREELAVRSGLFRQRLQAEHRQEEQDLSALLAWGETPAHLPPWLLLPSVRAALLLLGAAGFVSGTLLGGMLLGLYQPARLELALLLAVALLACSITAVFFQRCEHILHNGLGAGREVGLLAMLLQALEGRTFQAPLLKDLQAKLQVAGQPPSARFLSLRRLLDLAESRNHALVRLLGFVSLYDLQLAIALENWRRLSGHSMALWVQTVGEVEALLSLAAFSFENPDYAFPRFVDAGPLWAADEAGHPLLPKDKVVRNTLRLDPEYPLVMISGSNMSGKSTLLRTIGVNTVLALAGAPVCARQLTLSHLQVGASIHSGDSLQSNRSRFYAEILRLREVMQLADQGHSVLFLVDELLSGTNSHDRRIGAEAILLGLLRRQAIGLATTHDLALTQIAETPGLGGRNLHLEDQLIQNEMHFDYRLRPGIVTHSNAIALMRAVGLPVSADHPPGDPAGRPDA